MLFLAVLSAETELVNDCCMGVLSIVVMIGAGIFYRTNRLVITVLAGAPQPPSPAAPSLSCCGRGRGSGPPTGVARPTRPTCRCRPPDRWPGSTRHGSRVRALSGTGRAMASRAGPALRSAPRRLCVFGGGGGWRACACTVTC